MKKIATYLSLWHGRKTPDENLDNWGSEGPTFGPLDEVTITYASHVKAAKDGSTLWLNFQGDVLEYEGILYGDFTIFTGETDGEYVRNISGVGSAVKATPLDRVPTKYLH